MEVIFEEIAVYGFAAILILSILLVYVLKMRRESNEVALKIAQAKEDGLHEPVTLHPHVDINRCIKSGACVTACPEHEVLGIRNGKATIVNASRCIGHGACVQSCPVGAISLVIGTEKRGVDLPEVNTRFETNIPGIFIAGELGGMGLIKNAVTQGKEAVENIAASLRKDVVADYDLIIVGAGPAGISGSLAAKKAGLNVLTLEQDTLGGTISTFPRSKIVMTSPMQLPLYGKVKLYETSKSQLLELWQKVILKNGIKIRENSKVQAIIPDEGRFIIETLDGKRFTSKSVLLSIGRRGTPRKLEVPGENSEKVAYRLIEPETIKGKDIVVVGGGDSAIESALLLSKQNKVTLSYRGNTFNRIKPANSAAIKAAIHNGLIDVKFNTSITQIDEKSVSYKENDSGTVYEIVNDLIYIFAGGELPTDFLRKTGISISTKYGERIEKNKVVK